MRLQEAWVVAGTDTHSPVRSNDPKKTLDVGKGTDGTKKG